MLSSVSNPDTTISFITSALHSSAEISNLYCGGGSGAREYDDDGDGDVDDNSVLCITSFTDSTHKTPYLPDQPKRKACF